MRLRYIVAGSGPAVVLLHTLRTQLDMFQKVFPELAKRYRVYALDYPGHGFSDIPAADYTADFFTASVSFSMPSRSRTPFSPVSRSAARSRCCSPPETIRGCGRWSR